MGGEKAILFHEAYPSLGYRKIKPKKMRKIFRPWIETAVAEMMKVGEELGVEDFYASHKERVRKWIERWNMHVSEAGLWEAYIFPFKGKGWEEITSDELATELDHERPARFWRFDGSHETLQDNARSETRKEEQVALILEKKFQQLFPWNKELMLAVFGELVLQNDNLEKFFYRLMTAYGLLVWDGENYRATSKKPLSVEQALYFASLLRLEGGGFYGDEYAPRGFGGFYF